MPKNTNLALLVIRLVLAAILLSHGIPKLTGWSSSLGFFTSVNIPLPTVSLAFAVVAEVVGGILILLGVWVEIAALLVMIDMAGAIFFVVKMAAFDLGRGGMEVVIFAMALALLLAGPGRYALGRKAPLG